MRNMENKIVIDGVERYGVEVGKTKFENLAKVGDGNLLEYNNHDGLTLYVIMNNPTEEEKKSVSMAGDFEIAFTYLRGCGFVSLKFGSLPWGDCVFEPRLYGEELEFPDLEKEPAKGLGLYIMLIDSAKGGLVEGLRVVGLGREFSFKFIDWCKKQMSLPFNKEQHNRSIDAVFSLYDTKALVKQSSFRWKLGAGENGNERKALNRIDGR